MGHDYTLRLEASQQRMDVEQVFTCFEQVVAATSSLVGITRSDTSRSYAFAAPLRSQWPEDFVVMVGSEEWYLNFHAATSSQQHVILQALTKCLDAVGITGTFEEV